MHFKAIALDSDLVKSVFAPFQQVFNQPFRHWRSAMLMLVLAVGLTGCLDSQTSIKFDSPHRGQVVQKIQLGSQLAAAQGWLNNLESQARKLDATVKRPSRQELAITIPFTNAKDLETKFNQLVSPPQGSTAQASGLPDIQAHLQVKTSNLLLLQRDKLIYDIDLTALGLQSDDGDVLFDAGSGLDLNFGVTGPWGAGGPASQKQAGQSIWSLKPGQPNHIEATVWMPSPIGLGAAFIVGLVAAGTYYNRNQAT
ncbi:DUF3153 domain-containing protein [filamentous cyanobacterium LEGE 11480]|uniref:DUF3153 domain-containing protein n=1 Tax=Romeriopsis navalis LEGE 11480 TaxID=2777977 RepID=A0A928VMZ1_9CYAN|nr:DUF3153 domain-containing protein [Romeriopsis navalis]MBE9029470.1 DUF3153 domain-containing protein [Romeriopsis navalis LEGE 11480]